jgi:hypothetical protein
MEYSGQRPCKEMMELMSRGFLWLINATISAPFHLDIRRKRIIK